MTQFCRHINRLSSPSPDDKNAILFVSLLFDHLKVIISHYTILRFDILHICHLAFLRRRFDFSVQFLLFITTIFSILFFLPSGPASFFERGGGFNTITLASFFWSTTSWRRYSSSIALCITLNFQQPLKTFLSDSKISEGGKNGWI